MEKHTLIVTEKPEAARRIALNEGGRGVKCKVCDREALGTYCEPHERAYDNLVRKYAVWKRALGVSWREYLSEVISNEYTGAWVKEVAKQLMKSQGE